MSINFGLLQPQSNAGAKVVATLPNQPNELGTGLSGLVSGMAQGQQIAASRQDMQQKAALFPGQLRQQDLLNQQLAGQVSDADQKRQDSAALRDAAQKGEDQYTSVLLKQDPEAYYKFKKGKADYREVLSNIAFKNSETKKNSADVISSSAISLANVADAAHTADLNKPGSGQQVFGFLISQLDPDTQAKLKEAGLNQWNNNTNVIMHTAGLQAIADKKAKDEAKDKTPIQKDQEKRDALSIKIKNGTATDEEKQSYQELNDSIAKESKGEPGVLKGITDAVTGGVSKAYNAATNAFTPAPSSSTPAIVSPNPFQAELDRRKKSK